MQKIQQFVVMFVVAVFASVETKAQELEVGTEYVLVIEDQNKPKHLKFPSKREIIKRGAIADYQNLNGVVVTVESSGKNNSEEVLLKRKDGKPFFRFFDTIKANVTKALENGELARI